MGNPSGRTAAEMLEEQKKGHAGIARGGRIFESGRENRFPVCAPWWQCPAIAYWSGQPAVAGTSHEGMPGIVDTARFYITTNYADAEKILRARGVKRVIAYDSDRVLQDASRHYWMSEPMTRTSRSRRCFYRAPHSAPPFLKFDIANQEFKIFNK